MEKTILQFQKIESKLKNFFTSDVKTNGKNFPTWLLSTANDCLLLHEKK